MSKHNLTGTYQNGILLVASSDHWIVGKNAVVIAENVGFTGDPTFNGNSISVSGIVAGGDAAMALAGDRTHVTIAGSGVVYGGIDVGGSGSSVINNGRIVSNDYGIVDEGDNNAIINKGTIVARSGVFTDDPHKVILNAKAGVISASDTAIRADSDQGENANIVNRGRIESNETGIMTGSGNDKVINSGRIGGDILLGSGADVLDTRGGKIDGVISGGDDNDILITGNAKDRLVETADGGVDIVKSTVSYRLDAVNSIEILQLIGTKNIDATGTSRLDVLAGNSGNNVLSGLKGSDFLDGRGGNDRLVGGADGDFFTFKTGYDHDTIQHLDHNLDNILLSGWKAVKDFADVKSHARDEGANVVIEAGGDSLTILGMHTSDLSAGDFGFLA